MSVTALLRMRPKDSPMSWTEFERRTPPLSVALDGYVKEGPNEVQPGPRQNFNHHEGVYRLAARATCNQVLLAVRMDFYDTFRTADGLYVEMWANDCDEDVSESVFIFRHPHLVVGTINPAINRHIGVTDIMDTTAGAYPFPPDLPYLEKHTWTMEPYLRFRASGGLYRRDTDEFAMVVDEVGERIMKHIMGEGGSVRLETDYEVLHRGTGWCMVKEKGTRARLRMYNDGIRAFVSVSERSDGRIQASVGRFGPYTKFPVMKILDAFNRAEGLGPDDDRAGGSDLIGGTSRNNGTALPVKELITLTEETVRSST